MRPTSRDGWPRPSSRRCGLAGHRRSETALMSRKSGPHRELADAIGFKPHYLEHRSRLQDRLLKGGAENLPDYEILEILLAASNPRGDTKPLAKALIDHFGGLAEVLSAAARGAPRGQGRNRRQAARLGVAGVAMLKAVREAALRLSESQLRQARRHRLVGQADRLLQGQYRAWHGRGIPSVVSRPQKRADQA